MSVQLISVVLFVAIACNVVFGAPTSTSDTAAKCDLLPQIIDKRYPLTTPTTLPDGSIKYRIAIVSDLDGQSVDKKKPNTFIAYFKRGYLTYNSANKNVSIEWDSSQNQNGLQFDSQLAIGGRGLELSELVTYNGKLLTLDDKTGLVYIIDDNTLIPWVIVIDGNGRKTKGMKNEWATVKDSKLYVGSHGKEHVTKNGTTVTGQSMMWVKTIDANGVVKHLDWAENFEKLRAAVGNNFPGYLTHESCEWSDVHGRWFFLPRKASAEPYNDLRDERSATNILLAASPDFENIKVMRIGNIIPNHGYASFKFIPNTNDTVITAISTMEEGDTTATFITAFTTDGQILYPEMKVSDLKFEGFEFI